MNRALPEIHRFFLKRDKTSIGWIVLILIALIGFLDFSTGFEISFSFLYLVPIAIATWYIDVRSGALVTFISILAWIFTNWATGQTYTHEIIRYWNAFTRLLVFVLIIALLEEFKRALAHERMLSQTDFLTGIANSREFYLQANAELERTNRSKRQLTVAYFDLDGFKQMNDQFGHQKGDQLLRTVAQTIQIAIRKTDLIARLGGDEFAILLPNTGLEGAKHIMDRVHQSLLMKMEQLNLGVTLSAGVVSFISPPATVDEMLQKADRLMYSAKSGGRNKVFFLQVD